MPIVVAMILVIIAFSIGLVAGGALSCSVIADLHNLLEHLYQQPNDAHVRAIVRATLYQEEQ